MTRHRSKMRLISLVLLVCALVWSQQKVLPELFFDFASVELAHLLSHNGGDCLMGKEWPFYYSVRYRNTKTNLMPTWEDSVPLESKFTASRIDRWLTLVTDDSRTRDRYLSRGLAFESDYTSQIDFMSVQLSEIDFAENATNLAYFIDWQGSQEQASATIGFSSLEDNEFSRLLQDKDIASPVGSENVQGLLSVLQEIAPNLVEGVLTDDDLVSNGSFEVWACHQIPGWTWLPMADGKIWNAGLFFYGYDTTTASDGANSIKIQSLWIEEIPELEPSRAGILQQLANSNSSDYYLLMFDYRTRGLEDGGASIWVGIRGILPPRTHSFTLPNTQGFWKTAWLVIGGETDTEAPLEIMYRLHQTGEVWFDSVKAVKLPVTLENNGWDRYELSVQ